MFHRPLLVALLVLLSATAVGAQSVTGDFGVAAGTGSPYVFGGDDGFSNATMGQTLANSGVTFTRSCCDYYLTVIAPNTTLATYQSALAAGCPAGSVCDPNTWNWGNATSDLPNAHSMGMKTMGIMSYNVPWNSQRTTNPPGRSEPIDYNVWSDMVAKVYRHQAALTHPDYIEIWNEPDCCPTYIGMPNYHAMYKTAAAAIRSVDPTAVIAGPVISLANSAWVSDLFDGTIPLNDINFITFHSYQDASAEDGSMLGAARAHGLGAGITEWNADGAGSALDNNDPISVAFVGQRLIDQLNAGFTVSSLFALATPPPNYSVWTDSSMTTLVPKMRAFLLMSRKMGLGAGPSSLKQITSLGFVSAALAAVNSAGNPVMVFANHGGSSVPVTANFSNTGLSGTVGLQTYLADFNGNTAQTPIDNVNAPVSGGSVSHMFTMTPYSVAGIVLGAVIAATPTPSGAATPTPTPAAGGCTVTITSPVNGATVSGVVPVTVVESGCNVNNRLGISGAGGSNHFDFPNNAAIKWDTTGATQGTWVNGTYTIDVSAWDGPFNGELADSAPISVTVANGVATPTPRATPTPMATPTPGSCTLTVPVPCGAIVEH